MSKLIFSVLLIAIFVMGNPDISSAKMYKYRDENGKLHFTDDPLKIPEKFRKKVGVKGPSKKTETGNKDIKEESFSDSKPQLEPLTEEIEVKEVEEAKEVKVKKVKIRDLEGSWRGWGGVKLKRFSSDSYTGTYQDTFGTDVGRILLDMTRGGDGESKGEWWEGKARIGKLKFKVSDDGNAIRGTWCALGSSRIRPGKPSCEEPSRFDLPLLVVPLLKLEFPFSMAV